MKFFILFLLISFSSILIAQDISYLEYLRTDLADQKREIIAETMELTIEQSEIFYPIYAEYELELNELSGERLKLVKDYSENYYSLTDEVAARLASKKYELEQKRTDLLWKYYNKFKTELNPIDAAMFYQVESQLLMLIDVQVAGEIPIIKKPKK
jgi:5'-deoxynucleotidase YfbR-like HD superfamily hydrolase